MFITELNKYTAIYRAISYFGKKKSNNEIGLITPEDRLNFSIAQEIYKEEIALQLGKVNGKNIFTTANKIKHFGVLTKKKERNFGQNRSMSDQIIDTILVRELQLFNKYHKQIPLK